MLLIKRLMRTPGGLRVSLSILLLAIIIAGMAPIVSLIVTQQAGLDKSGLTVFFLIHLAAGFIVTLVSGYLSDRTFGRRRVVVLCGSLAAVGYGAVGLARSPTEAYLAGAMMAFYSVLFPQLFAAARANVLAGWESAERLRGITVLRTLFSLGFMAGMTINSFMARIVEVRQIFFVLAGLLVFLTAMAASLMTQGAAEPATRAAAGSTLAPDAPAGGRPLALLALPLLALILMHATNDTRTFYMPLVMFQHFGDAGLAPILFGLSAGAELATMLLAGLLASKIGERPTIAVGALLGACYFAIHAFSDTLLVLYLAQIIYAFYIAVLMGIGMAYVQNLLADRAGLGSSLFTNSIQLGSLVGILCPLLVTGYDQSIFLGPVVLCLVSAALMLVGSRGASRPALVEPPATAPVEAAPALARANH